MSNTETTFATIIIGVKHNKLSVVRSTIGTSGIIDTLLCRFEFRSTDWAGIQKQAVFQSMNDYVQHKDEGKYFINVNEQGECYVPAEVLTGQGEFLIGIFGMYEDGRRISSNMLAFKCDQGCYCIGTTPGGTTPDDYAKIKELIDQKQDKLTTGKGIEIDENNVISCICEGGYDDTELTKRIDENTQAIAAIQGEYVKSESLAKVATTGSYNDLTDKPEEPDLTDYATKQYVDDQISAIDKPNLDGYATEEWVESKGYLTEHQSLENYTTKDYVSETLASYAKTDDIPDTSNLATKDDLANVTPKPKQEITSDATENDIAGVKAVYDYVEGKDYAEDFVITLTYADSTYQSDKTYEETIAAINAKKNVRALYFDGLNDGVVENYRLSYAGDAIRFDFIDNQFGNRVMLFNSDGSWEHQRMQFENAALRSNEITGDDALHYPSVSAVYKAIMPLKTYIVNVTKDGDNYISDAYRADVTNALNIKNQTVIVVYDKHRYYPCYIGDTIEFVHTYTSGTSVYQNFLIMGVTNTDWTFKQVKLETYSNKTLEINEESTDAQYPSAKAVYDAIPDVSGFITEQSVADKYVTKAEAKNPLNITGATAGQIVKIKTIDADGNPTEWEAIDIPSGSGLSGVESVNGKTGAVTITASELIKSSSEANKVSIAEDGTLEVNSLTFDKILQSEEDEIILSGGGA